MASDTPNILFLFSDQMKANASHLYGGRQCHTPSLERIARDGVMFRHAFTPHPLCVPARTALMASRFPHSLGTRRNETLMPAGVEHAFKLWKRAGYRTGLIGKNHCFEHQEDLDAFDVWCEITHTGPPEGAANKGMEWFRPMDTILEAHSARREMPMKNPRFGYAVTDYPLEDYSTGLVSGQAIRFIEQCRDEPFALWVSFPDPHTPYEAPRQYAEMFPPEEVELPPWRAGEFDASAPERNRVLHEILGVEQDDPEDVRAVVGVYQAMTRFVDDAVGWILDAVERLGLRENTIVVFAADHGDFAGEHGMVNKGGVFYDCLTRVPLLFSWPGHVPPGEVDESMVNTIDIVPTLLRLQGIEPPREMQGTPLPTVTDAAPREAAFSEYGAGGPPFMLSDLGKLEKPYGRRALMKSLQWREAEGRRKMVRTRDWKYVHDPTGDLDELYDLNGDPWELRNVAQDPVNREVIADMQRRLMDWAIETEDSLPAPLPGDSHYRLDH